MPAQPPVHIVTSSTGRQIDASSIIKQLYRLERLSDWSHPETCTQIAELAGKLIAATGTSDAPAALIDRLSHHIGKAFRAHLRVSWQRVSEACD